MSYGKPCDDPPAGAPQTLTCDTQAFQDFCTVKGNTLTISLNMANNFGKFNCVISDVYRTLKLTIFQQYYVTSSI